MTKLIEFAEKLSLPHDAATQTIACIARKRAGKSYAAGKLAEGFHAVGVQFVVIDPVGNWYGLRVAADGKGEGLDVIILGGLRGDISLDPSAGALIADAVLDSGRSFVLDVSQFSLGERKRFVTAFGERLWLRQKGLADPQPIHVFLEEAQLFLPQQPMPDDRHMLGIWTEIVRLGGNKGIGVTLITQRPQSVTKEALTQVECLVVLQVNGVPEKKALKEWIVEKGADTKLLEELPFLKQGTAYIWSPQWLEHFGQHKILQKWTYDAGATPKVGVKKVQAELKPIDLEELRTKMSETVKKLEESDPRILKKRVAQLEKQLADLMLAAQKQLKAPSSAKVETKVVEVPVLQEKELKLLDKHLALATELVESMYKLTDRFNQSAQVIATESNNLTETLKRRLSAPKPPPPPKAAPKPMNGHAAKPLPKPVEPVRGKTRFVAHLDDANHFDGERKLGRGPRDMLKALASRRPEPLTLSQVATLASIKLRKSTFRNAMSSLRTAGFIREEGDLLHITDEGVAFLGDDVELVQPTTEDLLAMWGRRLPPKVNEALKILADAHPNALSHEEFGERTGVDITKSTYRNLLSKLRMTSLVVTTDADVRASETLFPN